MWSLTEDNSRRATHSPRAPRSKSRMLARVLRAPVDSALVFTLLCWLVLRRLSLHSSTCRTARRSRCFSGGIEAFGEEGKGCEKRREKLGVEEDIAVMGVPWASQGR